MVEHECSARRIRQVRCAHFFELPEGVVSTRIVHHREVHARNDNVAGFDSVPDVGAENFFGQGMSQQRLQSRESFCAFAQQTR